MAKKVKKQKRTGGEKSASLAGNAAQILKGCIGGGYLLQLQRF